MTLSISNDDFDMTGGHRVHVDSYTKVAYPAFTISVSKQRTSVRFVKVCC